MTKTTEELKREMYDLMSMVKGQTAHPTTTRLFENSLEGYLERLRQEREALIVTRASVIEERDAYLRKLQAFEFANKSAGEMLQAANEKIKRQRQSIGKLKNERDNAEHLAKVRTSQRDGLEAQLLKVSREAAELRKSQGAASVLDSSENDPESILRSVQRNCQHSFRQQHEFPSGKLQSECIFCLKVEG